MKSESWMALFCSKMSFDVVQRCHLEGFQRLSRSANLFRAEEPRSKGVNFAPEIQRVPAWQIQKRFGRVMKICFFVFSKHLPKLWAPQGCQIYPNHSDFDKIWLRNFANDFFPPLVPLTASSVANLSAQPKISLFPKRTLKIRLSGIYL